MNTYLASFDYFSRAAHDWTRFLELKFSTKATTENGINAAFAAAAKKQYPDFDLDFCELYISLA